MYTRIASVHQIGDAGMGGARGLEDGFAFGLAIGLPDVFDVQDGDHDALGVAQRDLGATGLEVLGEGLRDIEGDRHRPEQAAAQSHLAADAFVIGLVHEAGERREAAVESISRSQIWRGVRSHEGKSREAALVSAACSRSRMRLMSSPPCGGMRWLVPSVVFKGVI